MNATGKHAATAVSETARIWGLNVSHPRCMLHIAKHHNWPGASCRSVRSERGNIELHGAEGPYPAASRAWPTTLRTGKVVAGEGPVRGTVSPGDFRVLGSFRESFRGVPWRVITHVPRSRWTVPARYMGFVTCRKDG